MATRKNLELPPQSRAQPKRERITQPNAAGFDCVDLCDNEIAKLGGFPPMPRLSTLLVANNSVARIAPNLAGAARRSACMRGGSCARRAQPRVSG